MQPTKLRLKKEILIFALALFLGACASPGPQKEGGASRNPAKGAVVVLHFSDLHGRILAYPRLAALIKSERALAERSGNDLLVVMGGDAAGKGALPCRKSNDKECFAFFKEMGVDVALLGNGEAKRSAKDLNELIRISGGQWLSANVKSSKEKAGWQKEILWKGPRSGAQIWIAGWTLAPSPAELDPAQPLNVGTRFDGHVLGEWAKQLSSNPVLWVTHQDLNDDKEFAKQVCMRKNISSLALLRAHTHQLRQEPMACVTAYESGAFAESATRLVIERSGAGPLAWKVTGAQTIPLTFGPEDPQMKSRVSALYQKLAPDAETQVALVTTAQTLPDLALWLANAYRKVSHADVAVVNAGAIKEPLPIGPVKRERLLEVIPYNNELMGLDWPFADFEKSICEASRRARDATDDTGSELFFAGVELVNPGEGICHLKGSRKGSVKVVLDSFMVKKAPRWLGKKLEGRAFKFGMKTEDAMMLSLKRNGGKLP